MNTRLVITMYEGVRGPVNARERLEKVLEGCVPVWEDMEIHLSDEWGTVAPVRRKWVDSTRAELVLEMDWPVTDDSGVSRADAVAMLRKEGWR